MHPHFSNNIGQFFSLIKTWAEQDDNLVAIALVGSCANGTAKPDSDIDLVLIADNPRQLLQSTEWTSQFGKVFRVEVEHYGKVASLRAFYKDGMEVEFGITDRGWLSLPIDKGTQQVIDDGFQIIFEKDDFITTRLPDR